MTPADQWLERIYRAGRTLTVTDSLAALDQLDSMVARGTVPTIGWMQRNTEMVK